MANSGNVDIALISKLTSDVTLMTLAPGGVFREIAPQGATEPYIIVQMMRHSDEYLINRGEAFEEFTYMVKAVQRTTSGATVQSVSDRIHTVLQDSTMTITGYNLITMQREERIAYVELDENRDQRYQHRGGIYQVLVEPTA